MLDRCHLCPYDSLNETAFYVLTKINAPVENNTELILNIP